MVDKPKIRFINQLTLNQRVLISEGSYQWRQDPSFLGFLHLVSHYRRVAEGILPLNLKLTVHQSDTLSEFLDINIAKYLH